MERDPERLDQGAFRVRDRTGEPVGELFRPCEQRPQGTVGRAAAGYGRIERHPFSGARPGLDRADELVSQHERVRQGGVADRPLDEPVPIRSAEPDCGHADQNLPVGRCRGGLVVEAEVAPAVEAQRLHRL